MHKILLMKRLFMEIARTLFGKHVSGSFPKWWVLIFDLLLVVFSYILMVFIKYYNQLPYLSKDYKVVLIHLVSVLIVFAVCFILTGSFKGLIRYTGFNDITRLAWTCFSAFIVLFVCKMILYKFLPNYNFLFPSYFESFFITLMVLIVMAFSRLIIRRIYNEYFRQHPNIINAVIYGAGDAGLITFNALYQDTSHQYLIKSFIDDSSAKIGKTINGIPIKKPSAVLNKEFLQKNNISTMIMAMPSLNVNDRQRLINLGLDLNLKVKSVPHINNWINGELKVNQIEDIKIEDLLEREPIVLGKENVSNEIQGKVVMVTGAAGSIGSEICRQVLQYHPKCLVLLDQAESPIYDLQFELKNNEPYKSLGIPMEFIVGNVKDEIKMTEVFEKFHPQVLYHAAAYKHVPLMEDFPYEAVFVNVFGTKIVADLAIRCGVEKFVMISTDKAVNPTNVMGATKRIAEIYTQSRRVEGIKFVTTRFGNVLGSNGSVIPLFKKQLAKGGPLTVTDKNIIRYFMTIPEACSLVLEAGAIGEDDDIFVFDMGEPVKIYDMASKMIKLSGLQNVEIKITGLRPGEKLYEELLATKENTLKTQHPKIMRAKVRQYPKEDVDSKLKELYEMLLTSDDFKIVAKMKDIVPEFKSNNSVFASLDK